MQRVPRAATRAVGRTLRLDRHTSNPARIGCSLKTARRSSWSMCRVCISMGLEYTSSVNNPTPTASSASTASDAKAGTAAAPTAAEMSDVVSQQSLHQSMLADFGTPGLGHMVVQGSVHGRFGGAETLVMSPTLAGYTSLLTTSSHQATTAVDHHGGVGSLSHAG